MALEQDIAELVTASNNLTQVVDDKIQQIDHSIDSFIDNWGVNGHKTLEVGVDKPFKNIYDAFYSLNGKMLKKDVLIKVDDGIYEHTGIHLEHQPYASRIRIEGNTQNPSACVIKWVPDTSKRSHGLVIRGLQGLRLSGFKFEGETSEDNWTYRSLRLDENSRVSCNKNSIIIQGGDAGIQIANSKFLADGVDISKVASWCILAGSGSKVWVRETKIIGFGKEPQNPMPLHISVTGAKRTSQGIGCVDGSQMWAGGSEVSDIYTGMYAARNAYLWCDVSTVKNAVNGFLASTGATCWPHWWSQTEERVEQRAKAVNCTYGFNAEHKSLMWCPGAIADTCTIGFRSYASSKLLANSGWAVNCNQGFVASSMSTIEASSTKSQSVNNTEVYSPEANATQGNIYSIISYS